MIRTLQRTRGALVAVAMMLTMAAIATAQWDPYPWKRVPRTANGKVDLNAPAQRTPYGKPDLSGFWMPEDPVKNLLRLDADMKPGEVQLTPWAQNILDQRIANNGRDHPGVSCLPSGIPEKDNIPDGLKLVQTEDLTLVLHESRTIYRQIFTDGRPLPKNPQPTWMGYSIGHWEGTHSSSRPSDRTAEPGSTCEGCPELNPCESSNVLRGRGSATWTFRSRSRIPRPM
jgi:hypothetical protein